MTFSITGSVFRYILFLFSLGTIYFSVELLIHEDLSLNSVGRGRTTVCMVCFYLSFVGGKYYYSSRKVFTDSVKLCPEVS